MAKQTINTVFVLEMKWETKSTTSDWREVVRESKEEYLIPCYNMKPTCNFEKDKARKGVSFRVRCIDVITEEQEVSCKNI